MNRREWLTKMSVGAVGLTLGGSGCAGLNQILALRKVQFKLIGVRNLMLGGIDLSRVRSFSDINPLAAAQLLLAFRRGEVPARFNLDLAMRNPTENQTTAKLRSFDWALKIDNVDTIRGVSSQSIEIPPTNEPVTFGLPVEMNLMEFFSGDSLDRLVDLAAAIGGVQGSAARLSLSVQPDIQTPLGVIRYPSPITVVSRDWGE